MAFYRGKKGSLYKISISIDHLLQFYPIRHKLSWKEINIFIYLLVKLESIEIGRDWDFTSYISIWINININIYPLHD